MYLAEKTIASPLEIWVIVIVAVICLAFWLVMVVGIAPRPDVKKRLQQQEALQAPFAGAAPVPVSGGMHAAAGGRSVMPSRDAPAMEMPTVPQAAGAEEPGPEEPDTGAQGDQETRDDLPTVPGQRLPAKPPPMPAQRESATDQAAPSRPADR